MWAKVTMQCEPRSQFTTIFATVFAIFAVLPQRCPPCLVEEAAPGGLPVDPLAGGAEGGEHGPVPHQPQVQARHVVLRILAPQEGELGHG